MTARDAAVTDRVIALTRAGRNIPDIAATLGITRRTVSRHRKKAGIAGPPNTPLTDQQLALAKHLLDDGAPATEAARTIGCAPRTIGRKFPNHGPRGQDLARANCAIREANRLLEGRR